MNDPPFAVDLDDFDRKILAVLRQDGRITFTDLAQRVGLLDRGELSPGMKADINIIDFERLRLHTPEVIYDLPAGGRRVFQTRIK